MPRKPVTDIAAWPALTLEGNLIAPAMIAAIDRREAPEQAEADYGLRKGISIRDEIALAFRVGQAHYADFLKAGEASAAATTRFVRDLLRETLGFNDLREEPGPVALSAGGGGCRWWWCRPPTRWIAAAPRCPRIARARRRWSSRIASTPRTARSGASRRMAGSCA